AVPAVRSAVQPPRPGARVPASQRRAPAAGRRADADRGRPCHRDGPVGGLHHVPAPLDRRLRAPHLMTDTIPPHTAAADDQGLTPSGPRLPLIPGPVETAQLLWRRLRRMSTA